MVYILVLNYMNYMDTIQCLCSIKRLEKIHYKVVVVDNKSTNNSVECILSWIEQHDNADDVKLIVNSQNDGYAAGNNVAIRYCLERDDCEYIWILNNDVEVNDQSLVAMLKTYEEASRKGLNVGFVGSKIVDYADRRVIQNSGARYSLFGGRVDDYRGKDISLLCDDIVVDDLSGCSLFFRKDIIDKVGLIPEEYFLYYEETDWMRNSRLQGFQNVTSAKSIVYHKEAKSTGGVMSPFVIYYMTRNRIHFERKYKTPVRYFLFLSLFLPRVVIKILYYCLRVGVLSKAIFWGASDGLLHKKFRGRY